MHRPRAHVIEDESAKMFASLLPKEWIVRTLPKDYGVDYEVEIVEGNVVTGNRFWFQLKGTDTPIEIKASRFEIPKELREAYKGKENLDIRYFSFQVDTKLLEYSLGCNFPLLLGVVCLPNKEVYWLPLQDHIERRLQLSHRNWREQETCAVNIPLENSFSMEKKYNYPGLRWYALEPARMRAFSMLHFYHNELEYRCRFGGYAIGEGFIDPQEGFELLESLSAAKSYLGMALELDCLFGKNGLDVYIMITKPLIEEGLKACEQLLKDIPKGKISFEPTSVLIGKVSHAVDLMSTCIAMYQDFRERHLFNEQPFFSVRLR